MTAVEQESTMMATMTPPKKTLIPVVDYRFVCNYDDNYHDDESRDDNFDGKSSPIIQTNEKRAVFGDLMTSTTNSSSSSSSLTGGLYCRHNATMISQYGGGAASTEQLSSTGTVQDLVPSFSNKNIGDYDDSTTSSSSSSGITMEIWMTPGGISETSSSSSSSKSSLANAFNDPNMLYPIISISKEQQHDESSANGFNDFCDGLQFVVAQRGTNQLELRYKDFSDNSGTYICRVLPIRNLQLRSNELYHMVISWGGNKDTPRLQIFVNGTSIVSIPQPPQPTTSPIISFADVELWDPTYRLHAFEEPQLFPSGVFPGTIHQISLYNSSFVDDDVFQLYEGGPHPWIPKPPVDDDTTDVDDDIDDVEDDSRDTTENDKDEEDQEDCNKNNSDDDDDDDDDEDNDDNLFRYDPSQPLALIASSLPLSSSSTIQGQSISLHLGGDFNTSTAFWEVALEIMTLPEYGDLVTPDDGFKIRTLGSIIPLVGDQTRTCVRYQHRASSDFFSSPTSSWNGTRLPTADMPSEMFSFRLVALNVSDPSQVYGTSSIVEQEVNIIHRNHEPSISSPMEARIPEQQSSSFGDRPFALLENVSIVDSKDFDIDQIRVDVHVKNGTISIIDEDLLSLADFDRCADRQPKDNNGDLVPLDSPAAWFCQGDGFRDRVMTFTATPSDASRILSSIRYDSSQWEQQGSIDLTIYDGSGGPCLLESEHISGRVNGTHYQTIHDVCYQATQRVVIPAIPRPDKIQDQGVTGQTVFAAFLVSIILGCLCFCCCCTCIGYLLFGRSRSAPIEVMKTAADRGHVLQDVEIIPV